MKHFRGTDIVGEPAGRLHTARSRNDQVATDFKLWVRDQFDAFEQGLLALIDRVKPKKAVLTHMNNETDYETISKLLPKNCFAAYDGMKIII